MKGLRRLTASTYEAGDFVSIVEDSHEFASKDIGSNREVIDLGNISKRNISKLMTEDEQINNSSAIGKLPAFKSLITGRKNLKSLRRRKYHFDGSVKLKSNAQES